MSMAAMAWVATPLRPTEAPAQSSLASLIVVSSGRVRVEYLTWRILSGLGRLVKPAGVPTATGAVMVLVMMWSFSPGGCAAKGSKWSSVDGGQECSVDPARDVFDVVTQFRGQHMRRGVLPGHRAQEPSDRGRPDRGVQAVGRRPRSAVVLRPGHCYPGGVTVVDQSAGPGSQQRAQFGDIVGVGGFAVHRCRERCRQFAENPF